MSGGLKKISCDPMCGFSVQSHNDNEVIDMAMVHVKNMHPEKSVNRDEMKKSMVSA